uniref:Uncharacterized protein n=1 Tax=Arundo donax TaxID=35708 RepID=A0A0A8ZYS6_ARUDO
MSPCTRTISQSASTAA